MMMYNQNIEFIFDDTTLNLLSNLKNEYKKLVSESLQILKNNNEIIGLLWGGSIPRNRSDKYSDIDLFCLCKNDSILSLVTKVIDSLNEIENVDRVINQGVFQWLGATITIYFRNEDFFSIDIGFIDYSNSYKFFWEPDGIILWDNEDIISRTQKGIQQFEGYKKYPFFSSQPILHSVLLTKKIRKNLLRNHLWNCIEYLNKLRRNLIFLLRVQIIETENFLGNPERNIEDVFSKEIILRLNNTQPRITKADITKCTILILKWLLEITNSELIMQETSDLKMVEWYFVELNNSLNQLENNYMTSHGRIS